MKYNPFFFKTGKFALLACFCGAVSLLSPGTTHAAKTVDLPVAVKVNSSIEINKTQDLDFGTIDVTGNAVITINAKSGNATATKTSGNIIPQSGTSHNGIIEITSAIGMDFTINVTYDDTPNQIASGITLDEITNNSTDTGISHTGGDPSTIRVGGKLTIDSGVEDGDYSGTTTVTLDFS